MNTSRILILWVCLLLLVITVAVACVPTIAPEPTAVLSSGDALAGTATPEANEAVLPPLSPTLEVYPPLPTLTPTLPPYPWPTRTPSPTDLPEPTEEPTATEIPFPTLPPTPVVTPFPTAAPPFISFPAGTTEQPFTLYYRDGDVILSLSSEAGAAPQVFLEPLAEFGHYLPPRQEVIPYWGALSPDGRTMALVLTDDPVSKAPPGANDWFSPGPHPLNIYLMDMSTRELRPLVVEGMLPLWSPDSQQLAFRSTQTYGLWVVDVATGEAREVYGVSGENFVNVFTWAFDNRHMALTDTVLYQSNQAFVIDTAGVTSPQLVAPEKIYGTDIPQWSPISNQIALTLVGEGEQPLDELWVMNPDSTARRQLTHDLDVGGMPQWSPNGRWIAISAYAAYENEYPWSDLWLVDPAGAALQRLTYDGTAGRGDHWASDYQPMWSPDGTQLVYFKTSGQLWLMSLLDGSRRQLMQTEDNLHDSGLVIGR